MPFSFSTIRLSSILFLGSTLSSSVALFACGSADEDPAAFTAANGPNSSGDAGANTSSAFQESEGGALEAAIPDDCSEAAKLIYLTGDTSELWSFNPQDLSYKRIGPFDCLKYPTHMTVDRAGVAWVVDTFGGIYKASTTDAKCTAVTTWKVPGELSTGNFALSFAGTTGISDNTLYILTPTLFQKFDVAAGTLTTVGDSPFDSASGDLTSSGDGTLHFLRNKRPPIIYNLDTSGSKISEATLGTPAGVGGANAGFAFWGGSFWAFESSVLYRYDPTTQATTEIGKAPFSVTGAGQSTCVPKAPPVN